MMKTMQGCVWAVLAIVLSGCGSLNEVRLGDGKLVNYQLPSTLPGEELIRAAGYGVAADLYRSYMDKATGRAGLDGFTHTITILDADGRAVDLQGWTLKETYSQTRSLSVSDPVFVQALPAAGAVRADPQTAPPTADDPAQGRVAPPALATPEQLLEAIGGAAE